RAARWDRWPSVLPSLVGGGRPGLVAGPSLPCPLPRQRPICNGCHARGYLGSVLPFRRDRSWQRRVSDAARNAPQKGRELRAAAAQLDLPWARSAPARLVRENFMRFVLNPMMDYYAARRATGRETLSSLKEPVILVANHASHMDTPVILSALPRKLRKRTAVAAAADYFYR